MVSVSKFKVLKFLTLTSLTQAGSLQGSKLFWFLNIHGLLYSLSIVALVTDLYIQLQGLMSSNDDGDRPNSSSSSSSSGSGTKISLTTNSPNPLFDNNEDDIFGPPPSGPQDGDGGEVIQISRVSGQIFNNIMNIVVRILGFILFPKIIQSFQSLMSREFCASSYRWTRNEFIYISFISGSFAMQLCQVIVASQRRLSWKMIMEIIRCFIMEAYPVECLTAVLIIFTTVVSKNLQELGMYLEPPSLTEDGQNQNEDDDPVVEFRLTNEFPILTHHSSGNSSHNNNNPLLPGFLKQYGHHNHHQHHKFAQNQIFFVKTKTKVEIKAGPMMIKHPHNYHRGGGGGGYDDGILKTELLFQRYFEWFHFWKDSELVTGLATLLIFLHMTVSLCINTFIGISSYTDVGFGGFSVKFAIQGIFSIGTMVCLGNAAQFLLNVGEELEEKILLEYWNENTNIRTTSIRTRGEFSSTAPSPVQDSISEKQLSYLLHHMSQNPISLSALGFFVASRSTLTSICGVIVTYLVVLIQFKASS